jgi:hypothetical protein
MTLNDPKSPQYKALSWLVEEDAFLEDPRGNASFSTVLLERFVVVLLYFSTGGDVWTQPVNYLQPQASVCEWQVPNTVLTTNQGLGNCDYCIPITFV